MTTSTVDGNWGAWTFGPCSVTCGYGSRTKTRSCDNPAPAHGGKDCSGKDSDTESCLDQYCVANGTTLYVNVSCLRELSMKEISM